MWIIFSWIYTLVSFTKYDIYIVLVPLRTPPRRGGGGQFPSTARLMKNVSKNTTEATKAAPIIWQVALQIFFLPYKPKLFPTVTTNGARWYALPDSAVATLASHALTKTATPNTTTPAAVRINKTIQIAHYQRKFHPRHPDYPLTLTVTSHQSPVLEIVKSTQIMPSRTKTHPRYRPTSGNSRSTSKNSNRCLSLSKLSSRRSPKKQSSSPRPARSTLHISLTKRPPLTKTTEIMALRRRTAPYHTHRTHPW